MSSEDEDPRDRWLSDLFSVLKRARDELAAAAQQTHGYRTLLRKVWPIHERLDRAVKIFTRQFEAYESEVQDNAANEPKRISQVSGKAGTSEGSDGEVRDTDC